MKSPIRVGIIGQGRSGYAIHCAHLKTVPEQFKIAAVVDPIEDRRKRAEKEFGCDTYADYRELLKRDDIDLIVNSTPSYLHVPVTLDILNAGFNVLCEKPLARRVEDVDTLIATAKKSGKVFAIYQQSRFAPYFRQVKKVIDSGVLGRIAQISIAFNGFARRWDWQCVQKFNGGNLLNTGPHPLDQALQLFGTDIMPEVFCVMDRCNTFGDAEDYVKLILKGEGRPLIDLEISSCCAYPSFTYNVQGTRGGLKGTMTHIDWKYFKEEEAPEQHLIMEPLNTPEGKPAYCGENLKWYEESWDIPEEEKNLFSTISSKFYNMLYSTLTTGAPLEVTPEQVRQQIAVIEECHRQNPLSREY
ncbi:MAG TPA: Gfo/Idh/MocA family oxidoreductase [Clostridiales bacterium]|nr:Gfo/Idh/MocA family oxidoreductase [Clostridiales bacterium]